MSKDNLEVTLPKPLQVAMGFVEFVSFDKENSKVRVKYDAKKEFCHSGGVIQGGFVSGWIDAAMAMAVHKTSNYSLTPLSLDLKISFLNPALPGVVFAEAWIIKQGRSIGFLEGQLLDETGRVIATGSSSVKMFAIDK